MNKPLLGVLLGGILGLVDGLTALFSPILAPEVIGIVIWSTGKGVVAGLLIGYFAQKVDSLTMSLVFGLGVGLVLALLVAFVSDLPGHALYWEIILPGSLLGLVVGYATQKYGSRRPLETA